MAHDPGLLQRCTDTLRANGIADVTDKNVFGMRGLMRSGKMFAAVGEESIIVKLIPARYESALASEGITAFAPGGGKLGTWVEIDAEQVADDPQLMQWLEEGIRALRG